MKIAFNPSTVAALIAPPNNKDITFDLRGHNIFARGVKFQGTDTNTWRDIKINNVSIGSNVLDLRNGSNTTLTNTNGVVTINSTWRPVVDNLTSNSTTSSLSANQGRVLAGLINGKSDSDHNHDGRYVKKAGDTMLGALNFANNTWNKVGDDSYMGDCNVSGHVGIRAASATYPGVTFFNNAGTRLGNLTAYSGNIKYGAYSLQFLDNGNTSVNASTWTNPFSTYNSNAVADGQAICVWGQSSHLDNLSNDTGDMSLWLKRVNAKGATLNMVLDGEYYANGNQRLAHVSEIPTSLKNPYALTISLNGTSQGPYDGSAAKNINITPGSIGAAVSNHSHDYLVVNTADDKSLNSAYHNFQVLYAGEGNGITGKPANVDAFGLFKFRVASGWSGQMLLATNGNLYIRSSRDAEMTNTLAWKTILDSSNYSGILDSRYYTESEVNSLLDAKLNRQNLSYGTWNPRSYNLAADYSYNGGNLSISENGGKIFVSIDGSFWQNEGRYRVLDTSDVASLKGDLTVHQYLSATDATWCPLIWGGSTHANTSDSTGAVYKSHDKLSWQTSTQTLYTTHLRTTYIDLENNRGIFQVTSKGTSPLKGIKLPDLQSNGIGLFSRVGNASDEGGIILSEDTCVIYNSFDTGWGLSVRDKDKGETDISGDGTIAFGIRQDYRAYSLGGFEKSGSNNSYVLLGGGGHKAESALNVANADKVDGYHYNDFTYKRYISYNRNGPYNMKIFSMNTSSIAWGAYYLIFDIYSSGYSNNRVYFGRYEVSLGHWNNTDKNPTVYSRWIFKTNSAYDCVHVVKDLSSYKVDVYIENNLWDCTMGLSIVASSGFNMISSSPWVNLPSASSTVQLIGTTYLSFMGNADMLDGYHASELFTALSNSNNGISITVGGTTKSVSNISVNYASSAGNADTLDGEHASNFVRAGNFESANLNSLDPYSFIKSVNSNVASASPNGNTGWYNVIQLVHRNGASDGPSYIGQIALGMTTNTNDMFFRGKRTDPWKTVIHSGNIGNQTVNTAQYLRSLGNQNCQTGRTQNYGNVYTYNTITGNTGSPTTYTSVIGFGRGTGGTVEIAGGWCNTNLYWRSLKDCCENWFSWRTVLDSSNYTGFIGNYYWANVKISTSSSTTTSPTVSNLTATSSIKMGNILLEYTNEINNITNGTIYLNYRNSGNVNLCYGGGNVGIGNNSPSYKLDVNGQIMASGFHHQTMNSDKYMLLAGGGYKSFGGDESNPIFLGYLNLDHGNDGTISSSFSCLGYSVPFTYTRGGNYCRINIPDTTHQVFYIRAAIASVNYSGGGMDTWVGYHRGTGSWWLHCYASGPNEVRVKGFRQANGSNESWWGGNPLWSGNDGANKITVCIFGYVKFR